MEEYKYRKWVFTWNSTSNGELPPTDLLINLLDHLTQEYVFQTEEVTRKHYQGYLKFERRMRKATIVNMFKLYLGDKYHEMVQQFTLIPGKGTEKEIIQYVTKEESRVEGPFYCSALRPYDSTDLVIMKSQENWYPWQRAIANYFLTSYGTISTPDDRHIIWVHDPKGNSGKSKLVKYLALKFPLDVVKLPFGNANQIRASVIAAGQRKIYFIDVPRTSGKDEEHAFQDVISVIEDIKNGFIVSSMYGKYATLLMLPPHIIIFSNKHCPIASLSLDRWMSFSIEDKKLTKNN